MQSKNTSLGEHPDIKVENQIDEQIAYGEIVISYSCHMHPITRLKPPDFLDQDSNSVIDIICQILYTTMPMMLNFLLNSASTLVNIYFVGVNHNKQQFAQICVGTVIANILIYYLIEYMGAGFAIVCSYFNDKQEVGYLYQKTLGISFVICVFMTPVIYLSDQILDLINLNHELVKYSCDYVWALVPSYYLYSFLDTNKNYLQSQGIIFPPIVIHLCSSLIHIIFCYIYVSRMGMGLIGAAWTKNIADALCCLGLYFFIILKQPTKQSWVQWNIKSTNNIGKYISEVIFHEAFTYLEVLAFQIICIIVCYLNYQQIAAHFSFGLLYMILYFCFNSISQCINKTIALSIEDSIDDNATICKKKISLGLFITLIVSIIVNINMIQHRKQFTTIFIKDQSVQQEIQNILSLFCLLIFAEALNITLTGIAKTLELHQIWKYSFIIYYLIGIGASTVLCYVMDYGLWGIWAGWFVSIILSLLVSLKKVVFLDYQNTILLMRNRYKMLKTQIRASRMELIDRND